MNFFVFRHVIKESAAIAAIRLIPRLNKNSMSFPVKDRYNANSIRKTLSWALIDFNV
jgi:hypothetical protein